LKESVLAVVVKLLLGQAALVVNTAERITSASPRREQQLSIMSLVLGVAMLLPEPIQHSTPALSSLLEALGVMEALTQQAAQVEQAPMAMPMEAMEH